MDGWCSVADLTRWGFAHARVVMVNEAHNGWLRCARTRAVGIEVVRAAHEVGVRRLAMEALNPRPGRGRGPFREIEDCTGPYLEQPDMRRLVATALELGWSLWAYEAETDFEGRPDPAYLRSIEHANWRDREQARNLAGLVADAPGEPLLVWAGWGHIHRDATANWVPMGCHFAGLAGAEPFIIDQTVTISTGDRPQPWVAELLDGLGDVLDRCGGTAGIRREHAPPPLNEWHGVDAVVVSRENELT